MISEWKNILDSRKNIYSAKTHLNEKPANKTIIDKVHLKNDYVESSIINGRREIILFLSVLAPQQVFKILKDLHRFSFGNRIKIMVMI